tara:strand:+ start:67 stop:246 length:180 start_codon:yes stop_codon:yes gene_type:complete
MQKFLDDIKLNSMNRKLFEDIDARLLYGFKCSESNQVQQNYFERLKIQTESAFNNKKYV